MAYRKQLKDKNGNVVYPDVGVLGTNNIEDGAITSDKIDWTTFEDIVSQITFASIVSQGQFLGSYRFGKIAIINLSDLKFSSSPSATQVYATGLPKPTRNIEVVLMGGTTNKTFRCLISTDGELKCWYPSTVDLNELYYLNVVYKTQ